MSNTIERLNAALEGRYHVERELGEGGMAVVYLADDLKHGRSVALKVLKPELAAVVGAERFLAEIKTTANLQHPHILPLFDSGEADSFLFYVMPYLEGETLRERINREHQLPIDEAVGIATAVAAALQHAHDRGVIHRDIKPANILLQDGQPVVADFGIALAVGAAGGSRLTETGLSVGTPFYMSPEQATGDQSVGPASDTYSLAALLYEMLTGDPPYVGSTAQAVLGKIIQGAPVSATSIRVTIPENVDAAIRKALEKFPADRFAKASDFARALADPGFRHGETGPVMVGSPVRTRALVGALGAAAALFAGLFGWAVTRPEAPVPVQRFSLATTEDQFASEYLSLSADGSLMVMTYRDEDGEDRLFMRRFSELEATEVQGGEGTATDPIVSPDGREVAFVEGQELKVAPLAGGIVRVLTGDAACCSRWGSDGFLYYMATDNTIHRVPMGGGPVEQVTTFLGAENDNEHGYFDIMPDGKRGVFSVFTTPPRIESFDLETGERQVITNGLRSYITSTGHLVFGTLEGQILAAPFDSDALELTGPPVPVVQGVGVTATEDVMFTLAENGTLMYWAGGRVSEDIEIVWVSRSGDISEIDPSFGFRSMPGTPTMVALSPDGRRVAYHQPTENNMDVWIKELDRGPVSRLTFRDDLDGAPTWSEDGRTVYYLSRENDSWAIWSQRADGVGEPSLVHEVPGDAISLEAGPDGWLTYRVQEPSNNLYAVNAQTGETLVIAADPGYGETSAAISPDGRWVAYTSSETGAPGVYVRPFPNVNDGRWQIPVDISAVAKWSGDGSEIYFATLTGLSVAEVETSPTFRVLDVRQLFPYPTGLGATTEVGRWDVSADGQRFIITRPKLFNMSGLEQRPELILVQNFFEELKARVPN